MSWMETDRENESDRDENMGLALIVSSTAQIRILFSKQYIQRLHWQSYGCATVFTSTMDCQLWASTHTWADVCKWPLTQESSKATALTLWICMVLRCYFACVLTTKIFITVNQALFFFPQVVEICFFCGRLEWGYIQSTCIISTNLITKPCKYMMA